MSHQEAYLSTTEQVAAKSIPKERRLARNVVDDRNEIFVLKISIKSIIYKISIQTNMLYVIDLYGYLFLVIKSRRSRWASPDGRSDVADQTVAGR